MTDAAYDWLCNQLQKSLHQATTPHKKFVKFGDLAAGTCLLPYLQYPRIVFHAFQQFMDACNAGTIEAELEPHLTPVVKEVRRISRRHAVPVVEEKVVPAIRRITRRKLI